MPPDFNSNGVGMTSIREYLQKRREGVLPKSDDTDAKIWLLNWLTLRKPLLAKNIAEADPYSSQFDRVNWQYRPLENTSADQVLNTLISNMRSAKNLSWLEMIDLSKEAGIDDIEKETEDTLALYNGLFHGVSFRFGNDTLSNKIHEYGHSLRADPQEQSILKLLQEKGIETESYWNMPGEILSRRRLFDFESQRDPNEKVDLNYLNLNRGLLQKHYLDQYPDDVKLRLLNDIAQNDLPIVPNYAKNGIKLFKRKSKK